MWAVPAEALARDFRVIVPDIRGFGESSKFADPNEYGRKMVSDMHALFDHLGIQKAHVMGYSMGALIAAQLALDDPQRVMTVSLVAGPFAGDSATFAAIAAPLVASLEAGEGLGAFFRWQMPTWSDSAIAEIVPQIYAANDHDALVASMKALSSLMPDPARVKGSAVPAFIIVSKVDAVAPHARYLAGIWPNARLVELDTHDHSDIHLAQEVLDGFRQLVKSQSR
jgi:pimeloyl-ACP methyl ester carboxylesterase